ncbi:hypothetical protein GT347_13230 [Xylophilus rhododendri]|uniref:AsmA-like C-terminal domain-containing protein n=1 Tax=Xylophilus rhododendri TaxID=2697032 RepID=A0A857J717_9BURK|nr:AsmA-like C-terminal region-containing protein [Xylophilus rhododendri]QHI98869.1 hypothetical protein GT347_13230 [Xylophilus rhododendri]
MPHRRTALRASLAVLALVAVLAIGLAVAIPSEEQLARKAEKALGEKLGVPVHIGQLHWQLLPTPLIEVRDARTEQDRPIELKHLQAWPRLGRLLHLEIAFSRVRLAGASLPQPSLHALHGAESKPTPTGPLHLGDLPVARVEFSDVVWTGKRPVPLSFDGDADFDTQWRPRRAAVWRTETSPPARLDLQRLDGQDRWQADVAIASGTWNGTLAMQQPSPETFRITGELDPKGIDLSQLLEAFKRRPVLAGRASGHSTLQAEGGKLGEIVQSLRTSTRFSVAPATILRFDLDRTIRTLGKEHAGTTPLDSLTGVLDTQNGADGIEMRYHDLVARSGKLSARGSVVLKNRQVDADVAVDLVDGVVGVPLKITGPVDRPSYSVPASAIAGAAVGTAVLPGVGTVLGARIGDAIGRIFGGPNQAARPAAPAGPPGGR